MRFSDELFSRQAPQLSIWQTLADFFYPNVGIFTHTAKNNYHIMNDRLLNSRPVRSRRDLADAVGAMLREGKWFEITTQAEPDDEGARWLNWASERMRKLMMFRGTGFSRAMKEGDSFFITFGQFVCSVEMNHTMSNLLYRHWHIKDCAWSEDKEGHIAFVTRRCEMDARNLIRTFGEEKCGKELVDLANKNPFESVQLRHLVLPSEVRGGEQHPQMMQDGTIPEYLPYASVYICERNGEKRLLEDYFRKDMYYIIPRWQTIAGSPYAFSPASSTALPDARMLQAIEETSVESAERYARPTYYARHKIITGPLDLRPDGVTYVDDNQDNNQGDPINVLPTPSHGYPITKDTRESTLQSIEDSFHLPNLKLPDKQMTATEFVEWLKDYQRKNLPLFAPMEKEISAQVCERTFNLLFDHGLFGGIDDVPQSLQGQEVIFKFSSPLRQTENDQQLHKWSQLMEIATNTAQLSPDALTNIDFDEGIRNVVRNTGLPPEVLRDEKSVIALKQMQQQQAEAEAQQAAEAEAK